MAVFQSLMHRKWHFQQLWRQYNMVKYLRWTGAYSSEAPFVGRSYCSVAKDSPLELDKNYYRRKIFFINHLGWNINQQLLTTFYEDVEKTPLHKLKDALEELESAGIQKLEIRNNLEVLAISTNLIRMRSRCLREFGFAADVPEIIRYPFLLNSTTENLHHYELLPKSVIPFEDIMKKLECSPQLQLKISASCLKPNQLTLYELRTKIIKCLIGHNLGFSENSKLKRSCWATTCAGDVQKLIKIYEEEFSIPAREFQVHPKLLKLFPEDVIEIKKIMDEYKLNTKYIISKCHGIAFQKPSDIALILRNLFDHGITRDQITSHPEILQCSLEHVFSSLETISKWPNFSTLKLTENFTRVLVLFKTADIHMRYLKRSGFERFSVNLLLCKGEPFKKHLCKGEEAKACSEVAAYISEVLETPDSEIFEALRRHPWFAVTPVNNIKEVLIFLMENGFTRRQILNGLALVLYPKAKVVETYMALPRLDFVQPYEDWKGNDNILHLLLYIIEKDECIFLKKMVKTKSTKLLIKKKN